MVQVLAPCGVNDFVCGRASEWVSNGTELCSAAGFSVKISDEEASCYGSKARLDSIANSWKTSPSVVSSQRTGYLGFWEAFQQWVKEMSFHERVSWLIGSVVFSAGLLFARLGNLNIFITWSFIFQDLNTVRFYKFVDRYAFGFSFYKIIGACFLIIS